eukprot:SM000018S03736  [mRNA]  locus=s18:1108823:1112968:- [translate_table: standard]
MASPSPAEVDAAPSSLACALGRGGGGDGEGRCERQDPVCPAGGAAFSGVTGWSSDQLAAASGVHAELPATTLGKPASLGGDGDGSGTGSHDALAQWLSQALPPAELPGQPAGDADGMPGHHEALPQAAPPPLPASAGRAPRQRAPPPSLATAAAVLGGLLFALSLFRRLARLHQGGPSATQYETSADCNSEGQVEEEAGDLRNGLLPEVDTAKVEATLSAATVEDELLQRAVAGPGASKLAPALGLATAVVLSKVSKLQPLSRHARWMPCTRKDGAYAARLCMQVMTHQQALGEISPTGNEVAELLEAAVDAALKPVGLWPAQLQLQWDVLGAERQDFARQLLQSFRQVLATLAQTEAAATRLQLVRSPPKVAAVGGLELYGQPAREHVAGEGGDHFGCSVSKQSTKLAGGFDLAAEATGELAATRQFSAADDGRRTSSVAEHPGVSTVQPGPRQAPAELGSIDAEDAGESHGAEAAKDVQEVDDAGEVLSELVDAAAGNGREGMEQAQWSKPSEPRASTMPDCWSLHRRSSTEEGVLSNARLLAEGLMSHEEHDRRGCTNGDTEAHRTGEGDVSGSSNSRAGSPDRDSQAGSAARADGGRRRHAEVPSESVAASPLMALVPMLAGSAVRGGQDLRQGALAQAFSRYVDVYQERTRLSTLKLLHSHHAAKLKERQVQLALDANELMKEKVKIGRGKLAPREQQLRVDRERDELGRLTRLCADELAMGLRRARTSPWYSISLSHYFDGWNTRLQVIGCQFAVMGYMLMAFVILAVISLQKNVETIQRQPATVLVLMLGGICAYFGKTAVDGVGARGSHWLACWWCLCGLHAFAIWNTQLLYRLLNGRPAEHAAQPPQGKLVPTWLRKLAFHTMLVIVLPLLAGVLPFVPLEDLWRHFRHLQRTGFEVLPVSHFRSRA